MFRHLPTALASVQPHWEDIEPAFAALRCTTTRNMMLLLVAIFRLLSDDILASLD
jgi:hypothetical protein